MANSELQKMETDVHIKASSQDFYDIFCNKTHHIANIFPEIIQSVDIHGGEWGTEGSIICWNYLHDGKACWCKEVVEDVDQENKKVTFRVIEGDMLGHYKSFKFIMHATPKEKGSVVHWDIEYEKRQDHNPDPHSILQLIIQECRQIDAYLNKDQN